MSDRRKVDICVLSDIHLGTYGCHAEDLHNYLNSIDPELLILNGDIIDIWNFKKKYFPSSHIKVIRHFLKLIEKGTKVVYITGNHDDTFRQYSDLRLGNFLLTDKYIFDLHDQKHWVFHGDVFDHMTKGRAKIIAKLGGKGYDILILVNRWLNKVLHFFGFEKVSLSKKVKNNVKGAFKWISNFEKTASEIAIDHEFDVVVCCHIHQPKIETIHHENGQLTYLNSGDWVENLTALEYNNRSWGIYRHDPTLFLKTQASNVSTSMPEFDLKAELENILNFSK